MNTGNHTNDPKNPPRTKIPRWAITLREQRKRLGYTQATFGERFGVTMMAVSYWESGRSEPPIAVIQWLIFTLENQQPTFAENYYSSKLSDEAIKL